MNPQRHGTRASSDAKRSQPAREARPLRRRRTKPRNSSADLESASYAARNEANASPNRKMPGLGANMAASRTGAERTQCECKASDTQADGSAVEREHNPRWECDLRNRCPAGGDLGQGVGRVLHVLHAEERAEAEPRRAAGLGGADGGVGEGGAVDAGAGQDAVVASRIADSSCGSYPSTRTENTPIRFRTPCGP